MGALLRPAGELITAITAALLGALGFGEGLFLGHHAGVLHAVVPDGPAVIDLTPEGFEGDRAGGEAGGVGEVEAHGGALPLGGVATEGVDEGLEGLEIADTELGAVEFHHAACRKGEGARRRRHR